MSADAHGLDRTAKARQWLGEGLVAVAATMVLVVLLTLLQYAALRHRLEEELRTQAEIVGRTANAAVVFDSATDAQEILGSLKASPPVLQARLLRADRSLLAQYRREAQPDDRWLVDTGHIDVEHAIMANGAVVGHLLISAELLGVWTGLAKFVSGAALVMLVSLALALGVARRLGARVRRSEERTRFLAAHDALTGLPNRSTFQAQLAYAQDHWQRGSRSDALLFLDIDNFKQINDRLGHAAGDAVLLAVAARLRAAVRQGDVVARLAGDEFAVLLDAVQPAAVTRVAAEIVHCLAQPIVFEGNELHASASVGVALLPGDARTAVDALRCADAAMYQAKRAGKDGYQFYSAALGEAMTARLALETDLRAGLARGELFLAYQPIVDDRGKVVSFEALARWRHPQRGWVPPTEFIAVAEQSELIAQLGLALVRRLRADIDRWRSAGLQVPRVALNLSARQFRRDAHHRAYLDLLGELSLGPAEVEFELTESNVFEDIESPQSILVALQERGYALSIDDFGTGYSSLGYLRRMRCHKLKIDRSFVTGMSASSDAASLVQSIVDVAHSLRMQVVAEGVESERDLTLLRALRCDFYQGYGLSRPIDCDQAARLMHAQAAGERLVCAAAADVAA